MVIKQMTANYESVEKGEAKMMGKYYDAMYEEFRECIHYCKGCNVGTVKRNRIDRLYYVLTGVLTVAVYDNDIRPESDYKSILMLRDTLYDLAKIYFL
jgi:hypothetical protein